MNALQRLLHPENTAIAMNVTGTSLCAAAGIAAAPGLAAATGATAIPFITAAGNLVGLTILSATPIGWFLGTAAAAGAIGYGAIKLAECIGGDLRESRIDSERRNRPVPPSENEVKNIVHHAHRFLGEEDQTRLAEQLRTGGVGIEEARAALRECERHA